MPRKNKEPSLLNEEYVTVDLPQQRITITRPISLSELATLKKWYEQEVRASAIVVFDGTIKWGPATPPNWKRIEGEVTTIGRTRLHVRYFQRESEAVSCWFNVNRLQIHPDAPFTITIAKKNPEKNPVLKVRQKLGFMDKDRLATLLGVEPGEVTRCELISDLPRDEDARQALQWLGRRYGLDILGEDRPAEEQDDSKTPKRIAVQANQQQIEEMAETLAVVLSKYRDSVPKAAPRDLAKALQEKKRVIKRAQKILNDVFPYDEEG